MIKLYEKKIMLIMLLSLVSILLVACGDSSTSFNTNLQLGETVFNKHCAVCHGNRGQGLVKDWKKPLPNGKYPPPPLNGTAHTWHHSPKVLLTTINEGGAKLGGVMPGFKNRLNSKEKQAVIDYIYSLWPQDIKQKYDKRFLYSR